MFGVKKNKKTGLTGREGDYSWVATIVTRPEPRAGGRTPTHQPAANSDMQHATSPHRAAQVNECRCIQGVVSNGPGERWGLMSVSVLPNIIDFETQGVKNNQMWYIFLNIYKWSDSRVGSFLIQSTVTDQLEFISQVKSGIFFSEKANYKSFTAQACRGAFDTTKADLERNRLSIIWFIGTVCDPHVKRGLL